MKNLICFALFCMIGCSQLIAQQTVCENGVCYQTVSYAESVPVTIESAPTESSYQSLYQEVITSYQVDPIYVQGLPMSDLRKLRDANILKRLVSKPILFLNNVRPLRNFAQVRSCRRQGRLQAATNFATTGVNSRLNNLLSSVAPKAWFNLR